LSIQAQTKEYKLNRQYGQDATYKQGKKLETLERRWLESGRETRHTNLSFN